jgi:hypothetical protein
MARDMRDVHQLLSLIEQLADETGLDVTDLDIPGRKEEYLEYLAAISALRARAEKAQADASDQAILQQKMAATRCVQLALQCRGYRTLS